MKKMSELLLADCGTGAGGFKPGNTCAKGSGGSGSASNDPHGLLDEYPPKAKTMYDDLPDNLKTVEVPQFKDVDTPIYRSFTVGVPLDEHPDRASMYFDHEYAHHYDRFAIDNAKTGAYLTDSKEFQDVASKTKKRALEIDPEKWIKNIESRIKKKRPLKVSDKVKIENLQTFINAARGGDTKFNKAGFGHSDEYLKTSANKEMFTTAMVGVIRGDSDLRKTFPEINEFIDSLAYGNTELSLDCGTGAGGFKKDNDCWRGGSGSGGSDQTDSEEFKAWFGDSKVVDENNDPAKTAESEIEIVDNEPIVVFHGTSADFTVFDNPFGGWNMFSTSREYSEQFANDGDVKQFYLKIEKPLDLSHIPATRGDARNELLRSLKWDDQGRSKISDDDLEDLKNRLPFERDIYQIVNGRGKPSRDESGNRLEQSRETLKRVLAEAGYDGIRMPDNKRSVVDGEMVSITAETWIAFEPTQIKSATDNDGTFDPDNPDFRFSDCGTGKGGFKPGNTCWKKGIKVDGIEKLTINENDQEIEIANIRVAEDRQGEGLGTEAIEKIKAHADEVGKPVIISIEADEGREEELERFYDRLGFKRPGSAKDYSLTRHTHIYEPPAKADYVTDDDNADQIDQITSKKLSLEEELSVDAQTANWELGNVDELEDLVLNSADPLLFRKQIIYAGTHVKGKDDEFEIDESLIDHWVSTGNEMIADEIEIPMPKQHNEKDPELNRGFVNKFVKARDNRGRSSLYVFGRFADEEAAKLANRANVSLFCPRSKAIGGKEYRRPITHVCFTNYPVIKGLEGFTPLTLSYDQAGAECPTCRRRRAERTFEMGNIPAIDSAAQTLANEFGSAYAATMGGEVWLFSDADEIPKDAEPFMVYKKLD